MIDQKLYIFQTVLELQESYEVTDFQALQIAVKMRENEILRRKNDILCDAHVVGQGQPSALEALVMAIKHEFCNSLDGIANAIESKE